MKSLEKENDMEVFSSLIGIGIMFLIGGGLIHLAATPLYRPFRTQEEKQAGLLFAIAVLLFLGIGGAGLLILSIK